MSFPIESADVFKMKRHSSSADRVSKANAALPDLPHVTLEILRGKARQKHRIVNVPVFLIGSAPDCDLVLGDSQFPEVHTYLYVTPKGVSVRHLGIAPPLLLNGSKVETAVIHHQDRLQLGSGIEFAIHIHAIPAVENDRILRFDRPDDHARRGFPPAIAKPTIRS